MSATPPPQSAIKCRGSGPVKLGPGAGRGTVLRRAAGRDKPLAVWQGGAQIGGMVAEERYDVFLDLRGLVCPIPLVRTRQALMVVDSGATICVLATDPASKRDFETFCDMTGHLLLKNEERDGVFVYVIEKS
jgi:tRNA 2-thiouridine synthesizing protein A